MFNQVTQKLMAHVTLSRSSSYNLKANSCPAGECISAVCTSASSAVTALCGFIELARHNIQVSCFSPSWLLSKG